MTTHQTGLTPAAPDPRVRFHVVSVSNGKEPYLHDGMFGYAVQKHADDDVARYNADENELARTELRPVQEVYFVAKSTMSFEVVAPRDQGSES